MRRVFIPHTLHALPAQRPAGEVYTLSGQSMGTYWTVRYLLPATLTEAAVYTLISDALALVVAQMSTWQADSDLSRFNQAAADSWHTLPAHCFTVLACALALAADTDGAFDPTIGPLVNLWGFGPSGQRHAPPAITEIETTQARCGWQQLQVDVARKRVRQPGGIYLDFSGIAKGFAVDLVAQALQQAGLSHYLIEVGGELYGHGLKPDGQPWWVALETPPTASGEPAILALHGLAVATSGDYRRYFEHDGQRYAHTIDPRSGVPTGGKGDHGHLHALVSVTVLHDSCMMADALATAFTVMGTQAALAYASQHNIAMMCLAQSPTALEEYCSPTLKAMLE